MRGFGLAKSVLIVDEVHAYDAYMYGLLGEVLRAQRGAGGSAILLSATLPAKQRDQLLQTWDACGPPVAPYPALWHTSGGAVAPRTVADSQRPAPRVIEVECLKLDEAFPDSNLLAYVVKAAEAGAQVAVVMNLVDDAQRLARLLGEQSTVEVNLFHARFRFTDRQEKERACLDKFGREAPRSQGRILVATQVVEQSLDLDFDWILTQICPVDLLFQRLGRLHRHVREVRRRTEQLLLGSSGIVFPEAYRDWIERVYQRDDWDGEPGKISEDFDVFNSLQISREKDARRLTTMTVTSFRDEDDRITGLTRDGEMSLSVLPILPGGRFLDGQSLADLPEREQAEAINLNVVPVPASWNKHLRDCPFDKEGPLAGYWQLTLKAATPGSWSAANGKFHYSQDFGLEKARNEST